MIDIWYEMHEAYKSWRTLLGPYCCNWNNNFETNVYRHLNERDLCNRYAFPSTDRKREPPFFFMCVCGMRHTILKNIKIGAMSSSLMSQVSVCTVILDEFLSEDIVVAATIPPT
ncbi:hypothetical protein AVEN_202371-1 [Araneus ventricosus]|uniref:Uncharacterized protein n=1 Tax=Araneus ventricosus TaxID=182803 RepID=A0A4Y2R7T5_ARAVE|nr:hypothetical protein AVEN_202371-1 [Araneus ventricosus]